MAGRGGDYHLASSADEAHNLVDRTEIRPDIVISDYRLDLINKNNNGARFLKEMTKLFPDIFKILITAKHSRPDSSHHVLVSKNDMPAFRKNLTEAVRQGYLFIPEGLSTHAR